MLNEQGAAGQGLYRTQALEAHKRIEALPVTMRVTSGWTRATVGGLAALLLGSAIASAYVEVPVRVTGSGIVIDRSGKLLATAAAPAAGFAEAILVRPGEQVARGQPLAQVSLPEQAAEIAKLKATREGLIRSAKSLDALAARDAEREAIANRARMDALTTQIGNLDRRLVWLREREAAEVTLLSRGMSTQPRMVAARIAVQEAVASRDQAEVDRTAIASSAAQSAAERERAAMERQLRIEQAELDIVAAKADLAARSVVRSTVDGVVTGVLAKPGDVLGTGQAMVVVDAQARGDAGGVEAVVFVPLAQGKRVAPGDRALVAPASLSESEHDRIRATVRSVSASPMRHDQLVALLGSNELVDLATRSGPVFEVVVALEHDAATPSGFAWTSGKGPKLSLTRGTPLTANVTVERLPLIALALPAMRQIFEHQQSTWTGRAS